MSKIYNVVTIFPDIFKEPFSVGVLSKAVEKGIISINPINLRDYTTDKHKTTDDYQYGGGVGLVMKVEPIYNAIEDIRSKGESKVILLDPRGKKFTQSDAMRLSKVDNITFICGRYEGVDERVRELSVDEEFSIGDFILTGGEFVAMVMIDSVARLVEGVVGDELSIVDESFTKPSLEYPHYTRPEEFMGLKVPDVLLSGNHKEIDSYRDKLSKEITRRLRPDILPILEQDKDLRATLAKSSFIGKANKLKLNIALMHYPMRDKHNDRVATAITNLDLHDISRSSCTFGVDRFFVITPLIAQQEVANKVIEHWVHGYGLEYNPNRSTAFAKTLIVSTLIEAIKKIEDECGVKPIIVITTAKSEKANLSIRELSALAGEREVLTLFGTGWGFVDEVFDFADFVLEPIEGAGDFNHLSVRSAVAIMLSRLTLN